MPWHVDQNFPGCDGFAVVEDGSGDLESCEKTQADADAQIAILQAAEAQNGPEAPEPAMTPPPAGPGAEMMAGQGAVTADYDPNAPEVPAYGVLVVEGVETGDNPRREFAPGSLTWAPPPLSFKWQPAEAGGHDGSVVAGRIDQIWRDGADIRWTGAMDNVGDAGREAIRLRQGNFLHNVSILADDIDNEDVEVVLPPAGPGGAADQGGLADLGMVMPQKEIYHAGRIRSATLLPEAAFVEGTLELGPSPYQPPSGAPAMTAAAVGPHHTATADDAWDGPAAEAALPSPMSEATGRGFYAWIDDSQVDAGQMPKTAGRFGHHDVAGGNPGPANVKACQSGIGVLNGGRGGTTIPGADVQGVYNHLAGHLRDAGLEPPELMSTDDGAAVTAAAWTVTIPEVWPEDWFAEPRDDPPFGALHITPNGRVYGYLGPSQVAHRAFRASGRTVTIPRGVDYSEFQNKPCLVAGADGQVYRIAAGNITFDCGHPSPYDTRREDPSWAMQHYDNSCSIAARVRVGENSRGTWVAGGLLHGITPDAVERMMGCALSGDWQGGKLNAALLVPVEGFPVAAAGSVRIREGVMVASTVPVVFDQPATAAPDPDVDAIYDLVASAIGYDEDSRWQRAAAMAGREGVS
jgi:hypothetical protein